MQKTIIRPQSDAAMLRSVPDLIGMHPVDSVVIVVFGGKRSCGALRVDLPPEQSDEARRTWLTTVIGMIVKVDGADGMMPIVYTSAPYTGDTMREAELLRQISQRADLAGIEVKRSYCVAADGYGPMNAGRLGMHPRPLAQIGAASVRPRPGVEPPRPQVSVEDQQAFEERVTAWLQDEQHPPVHGVGPDGGRPLPASALNGAAIDRAVEAIIEPHGVESDSVESHGPGDVPCDCLALLAALLSLPATRDAVMLQIAWGPKFGRHAASRLLGRTRPTLDQEEPVVQAIQGGDMVRPDVERVRRGLEAVLQVADHSVPDLRAPAYATAGWLAWSAGMGTVAGVYVDSALESDPTYSFAQLMIAIMEYRMLPEWVYRPTPSSAAARRWMRRD